MFLDKLTNYFNPKTDESAWTDWVDLNGKYIADEKGKFILDAGCGNGLGSAIRDYTNCVKIGCDIETGLASRKNLDYWIACSAEKLCFKSESIRAVSCNWVVEHLERPEKAVFELHRILEAGGFLVLRTPNLLNMTILLSSVTSTKFHNWIRRKNAIDIDYELVENAPTYYRANTLKKLKKILLSAGFEIIDIHNEGSTGEYLKFLPPLYVLNKIGDLITDLFFLRWLKKDIVCVVRK
jgi:ubiquinone/menaquinone biosynthesis C-methylase UbiE